jgi:AbrB family looped-hinge helix DNA binding protein
VGGVHEVPAWVEQALGRRPSSASCRPAGGGSRTRCRLETLPTGMYTQCIPTSAYYAMDATVAERGQITLPKAVRDALGLTKGTKLKVELDGGRIVLRKDVDDALSPGDPYPPPEEK